MAFLSGRPDLLSSVPLLTGAMVLCRISGALAVWFLLCVLRAGEEPPRPWMHISFFVYATHYLVIRAMGFLLPGDVSLLLAAFLLAVQLGSHGELTFYCAAVYAVTLAAAGRALKKLSRRPRAARTRRAEERVTKS